MFCPQCGTEYRSGFTRCSDCNVELVASRPVQRTRDSGPVTVWRGDDPVAFSAAMAALQAAEIPTQKLALHDQFTEIAAIQPGDFEILVRPEDAARAANAIREALEPEPPDSSAG